jgi:hypothetical protein
MIFESVHCILSLYVSLVSSPRDMVVIVSELHNLASVETPILFPVANVTNQIVNGGVGVYCT